MQPRAPLPQLQQVCNRNSSKHKDHLGRPSFATTKPSKEGEEERSWCRVSPFPMKDRQGYAACWYKRVSATLPPRFLSNVERFTS